MDADEMYLLEQVVDLEVHLQDGLFSSFAKESSECQPRYLKHELTSVTY